MARYDDTSTPEWMRTTAGTTTKPWYAVPPKDRTEADSRMAQRIQEIIEFRENPADPGMYLGTVGAGLLGGILSPRDRLGVNVAAAEYDDGIVLTMQAEDSRGGITALATVPVPRSYLLDIIKPQIGQEAIKALAAANEAAKATKEAQDMAQAERERRMKAENDYDIAWDKINEIVDKGPGRQAQERMELLWDVLDLDSLDTEAFSLPDHLRTKILALVGSRPDLDNPEQDDDLMVAQGPAPKF